jgi:hypothetical protein
MSENRDHGDPVTLDRRAEYGRGADTRPDPLGHGDRQLVAAPRYPRR